MLFLELAVPVSGGSPGRAQLQITSAVHDAPKAERQLGEGVSGAFPELPVLVPAPVAAAGRVT